MLSPRLCNAIYLISSSTFIGSIHETKFLNVCIHVHVEQNLYFIYIMLLNVLMSVIFFLFIINKVVKMSIGLSIYLWWFVKVFMVHLKVS